MTEGEGTGSAAVFGVGWVLHDTVLLVPEYPAEDTKTEALRELDQLGGPVARALSVISSLGRRTAISAVLGDDRPGVNCLDALRARSVDTAWVRTASGGSTRRSHAWVSDRTASRTITYSRGVLPDLDVLPGLMTAVSAADVLHLDGRELQVALPLAARMRELRKTVVLDAGGWKPDLESLLDYTDLLVVSASTLKAVRGEAPFEAATNLRDTHRLRAVIVTDGSRGAWVLENDAWDHVPAPAIDPVDTNGAGDAFAGGVTYGVLMRWPLLECARFGSGVAALVCERFGDVFPTLGEIVKLLERDAQRDRVAPRE